MKECLFGKTPVFKTTDTASEDSDTFDALASRYLTLKKKERYPFYRDNIAPLIIPRLAQQVEESIKDGSVRRYAHAVCIIGHKTVPTLTVIRSLRPAALTFLYTESNKKSCEDFAASLSVDYPSGCIETVLLDNNDHRQNIGIMRKKVREKKALHGSVVCDVTAGKKIISSQLGIIAHGEGCDLVYLDAEKYFEGENVPYPGSETLFFQEPADRFSAVETSAPRLCIGWQPSVSEISFELMLRDSTISRQRKIDPSHLPSFVRELRENPEEINSLIRVGSPDALEGQMSCSCL